MSTAAVLNNLGQTILPRALAYALPDTLTVQGETQASDSGGGYYVSANTNAYTSVPCAYEPLGGARFDANGKLLSTNAYRVTMPTHYNNAGTPTRINLNPASHRLIVASRGNEPAKTFRIVSVSDDAGAVFEVTCEREN
jgi:hypothetical protein